MDHKSLNSTRLRDLLDETRSLRLGGLLVFLISGGFNLMKRFNPGVFLAILLTAACLQAEEGMWMPQQIPQLAPRLKTMGFKGNPKAFADLTGQPMGAIVSLGGCTASFVSPDGLIVTNHHCVTGGLQFNSTPQRDLLRDGFLAKTHEEELSNGPNARVFVTTSVVEITDKIMGNPEASPPDLERHNRIEQRRKEYVAECEKTGQRCTVAAFFGGLKYFAIVQMEIKDVRLVYVPAEGIGVFGGETDNWRWPRHTGDWSFLRAYVGKDGKPAPYSKDNVPFKPVHWLKVSPTGANPGELIFVVGYPGRTQRQQTFAEVKETTEWTFPRTIRLYQEQLSLIDSLTKNNKAMAIKLANRIQGLNNSLTNIKGMHEGLVKGGVLQQKEAQEKELADWMAADPARQKKYGEVLPALKELQAETEKKREQKAVMNNLTSASSYLSAAQTLYKLSTERPRKDLDRDPGYQERDWVRIRENQERVQRSMDAAADRALLGWAMGLAAGLPSGQRIEALDKAANLQSGMPKSEARKAIEAFLDKLYASTKIGDKDYRLGLLDKTTADLEAGGDSFIQLASLLYPLSEAIQQDEKKWSGADARLRPKYMEALLAKSGGLVAPDANSTLRVTYGQIKGVDAKDGLFYKPQTTLAGIVEKNTGEGDFDAPKIELDAIKASRNGKKIPYLDPALKDVPVDFLSTVDTTGGNSGSPTLNGKGELVGLLFDGTYESVASNFLFDPVKTRSIHVDSRYMLWTMQEVDGASHLIKEMDLQ